MSNRQLKYLLRSFVRLSDPDAEDDSKIEPILTHATLDANASSEDKLLHRLLCDMEAEAYRRASKDGPAGFRRTDQYFLDMQDKVWDSISILRANVNKNLNGRVLIARLPHEILGRIFEHYVSWWEMERKSMLDPCYPSDAFEWFPIVKVLPDVETSCAQYSNALHASLSGMGFEDR